MNAQQDFGTGKFSSTQEKGTLNPRSWFSKSSKAVLLKIDVPLLFVIILLMIFGILMVYSASYDISLEIYGNPLYIVERQALFMIAGFGILAALVFFDYHFWQKLAVPMMVVTIIALIAVLVVGRVSQGAQRTLIGNSVQPSELAKLAIVIYLAVWLVSRRQQINQISFGLIPMAVMLGLLGGLIYVQPDLSAVITIFIIGGIMFALAGGDLRQILALFIVSLVVGLIVIYVSKTGYARISGFIAGLEDPLQAPTHVRRSIEAFINGGWLGVGIGKGQTKLTGLPVPHTDSIFAVVGEETGMIGCLALLILFSIMLWRGLTIARRAPDQLGTLLAAGLTIWLATEAFINMAVMVSLIPFAGNALPFISYGGSNLIVSIIAIGTVLNISRLSVQNQEENGRLFSEVINLRWRNGRRSLSRPGHPRSHTRTSQERK